MIKVKVSQNKPKILEFMTKKIEDKSDNGIVLALNFVFRMVIMYIIIKNIVTITNSLIDNGLLAFIVYTTLVIILYKCYRYLRDTHHISYLNNIVLLTSNRIVRLVDVIDVDKTLQNMEDNKLKYIYLNLNPRNIELFENDKYFKLLKENDKHYIAYQYLKSDKWSKDQYNDLVESLKSLHKQNEIAKYEKEIKKNSSKIKKYHRLYEQSNVDQSSETIKNLINTKNKLM